MNRTTLSGLRVLGPALFALCFCSPAATAAEEEGPDEGAAGESRISGLLQLDLTNAYFFRGILQEKDDFIAQPWAELYLSAYQSETGPIRNFTVGLGVWNSLHQDKTLGPTSNKVLYETDWYPLVEVKLPFDLTWTTVYYFYTGPDTFRTTQELDLKLAYDDSDALGRFALAPWINFAIETHRSVEGRNKGTGVQMGVEPTLYSLEYEKTAVDFTLPLELGLSIEDYYEKPDDSNAGFGYLSFGLAANVPLSFIDPSFGAWNLGLAFTGFYFSHTLAQVNHGDDFYPMVMGSLAVEF